MNLQAIFDAGVKGVLGQGTFAVEYVDDQPSCRYRGPNGTRCAIGWSISDDEYKERFEHSIPAWDRYKNEPSSLAKLLGAETKADCQALCEFQECHDFAESEDEGMAGFKARARTFAKRHGLKINF